MNTHVLIYDGFVNFEIMLATYLMKTQGSIITVGLTSAPVKSYEDFIVLPNTDINQLKADDIELLIIPGGDMENLKVSLPLASLIKELDSKQKYIGAICSAATLLQHIGILEGRQHIGNTINSADLVKVDNNILTAKPNGYVDFAIELGKMLNIYSDEDDLKETVNFFKYFKNP
ncbi:DJ-1/PfpI family protein [compost metagenome]